MSRITIKTITGKKITIAGATLKYANECYYINGESYPKEIVIEVEK